MTQIDKVAEAIYRPWMNADKTTMRVIAKDAIEAYESARAPRKISRDEFERVVDAIAYEMSRSSVRGSKVENAAHAALATLGVTVEGE